VLYNAISDTAMSALGPIMAVADLAMAQSGVIYGVIRFQAAHDVLSNDDAAQGHGMFLIQEMVGSVYLVRDLAVELPAGAVVVVLQPAAVFS